MPVPASRRNGTISCCRAENIKGGESLREGPGFRSRRASESNCGLGRSCAAYRHRLSGKKNRKSVASRSSLRVVYVAIAANLAIAASKYVAAIATGSPAVLAEALHSTADTGNELLLLLGMKRSARKPDALHAFGHGKALYFYSLLVAVFIFGIGGILPDTGASCDCCNRNCPATSHGTMSRLESPPHSSFIPGSSRVVNFGLEQMKARVPGRLSSEARIRSHLRSFLKIQRH
jgi:hypothetical protein